MPTDNSQKSEPKPKSASSPGGGDKQQIKDFQKSVTPYMDMVSPIRLGDEAKGSDTELVRSLLTLSATLVQGEPGKVRQAVDFVKDKLTTDKQRQKSTQKEAKKAMELKPEKASEVRESSAKLLTTIKKLNTQFSAFEKNYNSFFSIGDRVLGLIEKEAIVMFYEDQGRLDALAAFFDSVQSQLTSIQAKMTANENSGYQLAKKLVTGESDAVAKIPFVTDYQNKQRAKKLEDRQSRERKSSNPNQEERTYLGEMLVLERSPEEYTRVWKLGKSLKAKIEELKTNFETVKEDYLLFTWQADKSAKTLSNPKTPVYQKTEDTLKGLSKVLEDVSGQLKSVSDMTFSRKGTNALAITKEFLDKDRWKRKSAVDNKPEDPSAAPEQGGAPAQPAAPGPAKNPPPIPQEPLEFEEDTPKEPLEFEEDTEVVDLDTEMENLKKERDDALKREQAVLQREKDLVKQLDALKKINNKKVEVPPPPRQVDAPPEAQPVSVKPPKRKDPNKPTVNKQSQQNLL